MEIDSIKLIELISVLNNYIEGFDEVFYTKNLNLKIKEKILILLIKQSSSPNRLLKILGIHKTNLALNANKLIKENLIESKKDNIDARSIIYSLTNLGKQKAEEILNKINKNLNKNLDYKGKNEEINNLVNNLLKIVK